MANGDQPQTQGRWGWREMQRGRELEEAGRLMDGEQRHHNFTGRDQAFRLGHCELSFLRKFGGSQG